MWLARLAGKRLLCNCRLNATECWAHILLAEFMERLGDRITTIPCASAVAGVGHEGPEMAPFKALTNIPDIIDNGLPQESVIPCAVMWDFFAGMCVLTQA